MWCTVPAGIVHCLGHSACAQVVAVGLLAASFRCFLGTALFVRDGFLVRRVVGCALVEAGAFHGTCVQGGFGRV